MGKALPHGRNKCRYSDYALLDKMLGYLAHTTNIFGASLHQKSQILTQTLAGIVTVQNKGMIVQLEKLFPTA